MKSIKKFLISSILILSLVIPIKIALVENNPPGTSPSVAVENNPPSNSPSLLTLSLVKFTLMKVENNPPGT
ncbi:hypothetical protein IHV10_21405 [Fictibacillus sp. 5RED26]|uniref:hypothetical protein n=1 Tax=Fictibacillus sp. 5RED26 TaxID=2745876 RepID=UPI0018CD5C8A|nr:hypothetical protein [Fictibacillus sp. 5RED26]MBH0158941.1 hypothetical protein [Fictibacillus sp. 5RED26]